MTLKITRRPFTECPFRWHTTIDGVADGQGTVSDSQCLDLNGEFDLDFKSCVSQHNLLVWEGDCEQSYVSSGCATYSTTISGITGFDCSDTYNGTFVFHAIKEPWLGQIDCVYKSQPIAGPFVTDASVDCTCSVAGIGPAWLFPASFVQPHLFANHSGFTVNPLLSIFDYAPAYYVRDGGDLGTPDVVIFNLARVNCGTGWPSQIICTKISIDDVGPEIGDRIRSRWHLEYDIEQTKWTLRSFNRVGYPMYSTIDSTPCEGNEKVLYLETPTGSVIDGCSNAPPTVTITKTCPPDRVARRHKRSKYTGQLRRPCGCACDDEPDDRRYLCHAKCESTETDGCSTYATDQIECKFPESADCCDYCDEDKAPCAYVAEMECNRSHEGNKLAASQIVLRHVCYFSEPCTWTALGAEAASCDNLFVDGYPGGEPLCANCDSECPTTGCTWEAWANVPDGTPIVEALGTSWQLEVQETAVLFWLHPIYGRLEYIGSTAFLCDNVNSFSLTSQGTLPDGVLPLNICVKPRYDGVCGCYDAITEDCGYSTKEDRCDCCDVCCPCIAGKVTLTCCDYQEFNVNWCGPGRAAHDGSNVGWTRETTFTFVDCDDVTHDVISVIYCTGGGSSDSPNWSMDLYCDGTYETKISLATQCCPFQFSFSIPSLSCANCSGIPVSCSSDTVPNTIHAEISCSTLGTVSVTMTNSGPDTWSGEVTLDCGILRGNIEFCYGEDPTAAVSGWTLVPLSGLGLCWSFGSATNAYTINGTLSPLLFTSSSGSWTSEGASESCDCGSLDGESVTESYTV